MKYVNRYYVLILLVLFTGCQDPDEINLTNTSAVPTIPIEESYTDSPYPKISLEYAGSIGSENENGYVFSLIKGIVLDSRDNLYVLDNQMMNIRRFSPHGELLSTTELPRGEGPGEFLQPTSIALSENGLYFYVSDQGRRNISVLDDSLKYLRSFPAPTNYAYLSKESGSNVLASFNQFDIKEAPLLRIFNENGYAVNSFGSRHSKFTEMRNQNLQNFYLTFQAKRGGRTFLSYGYPYDLHVYDSDEKLIKRINRSPDFFGSTFTEGEFTFPSGVVFSLVSAADNLLLHVLFDRRNKITFVDAIDYEGRSRGYFEIGDEQREWGHYMYSFPDAVSSEGHVYFVVLKPYPRIIYFTIVYHE